MPKYHVNPTTGNPGVCKAKVKCRFGSEDEHYVSKNDAREAVEARLAGKPVPPHRRRHSSYFVDEAGLQTVFDRMEENEFFFSARHRAEKWYEIASKEGEHWYSNNITDFKIFHHKSFQGTSSFEVRNTRRSEHPTLDAIFILTDEVAVEASNE